MRIVILFARSIVLARLLPVEVFGIYAGALVIITISAVLFNFGLGGAFLYISNQGVGEKQAAAAHFTLNLLLKSVWAVLLIGFALIFRQGLEREALIVLTLANFLVMLALTPQLILSKRVVHRRLALLDLSIDLGASLAAIGLALLGAELWSLLATNVVAGILSIALLYLYRPVWRPQFSRSRVLLRRFLNFGWRNVWADLLKTSLDKVDDLWTVVYLGTYAMGLYSRAYAFAIYPRKILAMPVNSVAMGVYAELANDRLKLSQAFFRINALLLRAGFLLAGALALIAPEFIHLIIGDKWLPFLEAFRLMLIYTFLDPIKLTTGYLFVAAGVPEKVVRIRLVQLIILAAGLYLMGERWGIAGVALAVDLMLVVGITLLLREARQFVDISVRKLFQAPLISVVTAGFLVMWALTLPAATSSYWHSAFVKLAVFVPTYMALLLAQEWRTMKKMISVFKLGYMKNGV